MPPGSPNDRPVRIGWVGDDVHADLADDDRCSVRPVGEGVNCVVVDWSTADAPGAAVQAAAKKAPVVAFDPAADGTAAAAATRAGATEYVTPDALGADETLGDRVLAVAADAQPDIDAAERKRSLRQYKAVHEAVKQMIYVVGPAGRVQLVTDPLVERVGYDREALLGEHISEFIDEDVYQTANEAVVELQSNPSLESRTIETTLRTADGEPTPVSITLSLLSSSSEFEGIVGVIQDRSELAALEEALADERTRFAHLFDRLPDAVVDTEFVDGEPIVRSVNEAFEEIFGYDEETVRGESVNDLIVPDEYQDRARDIDRSADREGYEIYEVERETASGRKDFLFRGFLYPTDDDAERGFGIYTDITDRLEQEQRLQVLHRVLRHNLRNQMTSIMGYADLLAERTDGDATEYAARIRQEASEVAGLGKQVQRIEQALDRETRSAIRVDPLKPVAAAVEDAREEYPDAEVRVSIHDDSPVLADELLELAVSNLVENAIEHNDADPTVDVEIAPSDDDPDQWLDITVSDDGPGIPEREREIITGKREITQVDHSMGLGLWVARWIIDGVGGRLLFNDPDEGGASVTLRLRRADAEQSPA